MELLTKSIELARDGHGDKTGLPEHHPLVRFAKNAEDLGRAIALDDTVIWGALPLMQEATDSLVSEFAQRLRERDLFRCVDIRTLVAKASDTPVEPVGHDLKVDIACEKIVERLEEWNVVQSKPRVLVDVAERSPYKLMGQTKGPLDQINIRTPEDTLVDLRDRSRVVAALQTFKLTRAYVRRDDTEAFDFVCNAIKELGA